MIRAKDKQMIQELQGVLPAELLKALGGRLVHYGQKIAQVRQERGVADAEVQQLDATLSELMNSRLAFENRLDAAKRSADDFEQAALESNELAGNIMEEINMIHEELETLTQVLFEEANAMVAIEARETQEMRTEMQQTKETLEEAKLRFRDVRSRFRKTPSEGDLWSLRHTPEFHHRNATTATTTKTSSSAQNSDGSSASAAAASSNNAEDQCMDRPAQRSLTAGSSIHSMGVSTPNFHSNDRSALVSSLPE